MDNLLPESIITDFGELNVVSKGIELINHTIQDIALLINSYNKHKSDHDSIEEIDLSEIESLIEEITEIDTAIDHAEALSNQYAKLNAELANEDHKLKAVEIQLSAFKICPTCKRPM